MTADMCLEEVEFTMHFTGSRSFSFGIPCTTVLLSNQESLLLFLFRLCLVSACLPLLGHHGSLAEQASENLSVWQGQQPCKEEAVCWTS